MKYTVTDVTTSHILVKFESGSLAHVNIEADWDKERIEDEISKFIPVSIEQKTIKKFNSIEDVPLSLGESNDIEAYSIKLNKNIQEQEKLINAQIEKGKELRRKSEELEKIRPVDYKEARSSEYPSLLDQLDALYWSRNGDNSKIEEIDKKINQIKEKYPKDMKPVPAEEFYKKEEKEEESVIVVMDGQEIEVPKIED